MIMHGHSCAHQGMQPSASVRSHPTWLSASIMRKKGLSSLCLAVDHA